MTDDTHDPETARAIELLRVHLNARELTPNERELMKRERWDELEALNRYRVKRWRQVYD
jgi:hypothetical protein